jgi:hypothetical protein
MRMLFHRTSEEAARAIKRDGFRDGTGTYLTDREWTGVWLSDRPADANEGAFGDTILRVAIPDDVDLDDFEWIEEGKPIREWLVPADLLNACCTISIVDAGG